MKKGLFSIVLCLAFLVSASSVSAQDAAQDKVYREELAKMFEASGSMATIKTVVPQMISIMRRTYSNVPDTFWTQFGDRFTAQADTRFLDLYVPIYKKYLTLGDLKKIVAFYKSPVGKKLAEATPVMSAEAMQAGQQLGQEIGREIIEKLQTEGYIEE